MQSARHRCLAVSWWDEDKQVGNCIFLGSSDTGKAVETLAKLKATFAKIEELEKMGRRCAWSLV